MIEAAGAGADPFSVSRRQAVKAMAKQHASANPKLLRRLIPSE